MPADVVLAREDDFEIEVSKVVLIRSLNRDVLVEWVKHSQIRRQSLILSISVVEDIVENYSSILSWLYGGSIIKYHVNDGFTRVKTRIEL